ncbi:MAG TPA: hypothetical protein PK919_02360 [Candidatus Aminicenantes bacterium]|nr:hypothetical protein [Candidatus Aminicenantes bacterium]
MLIDMDEMMKALKKVMSEEMKRAVFEGVLESQGKRIRYFAKHEDLIPLSTKKEAEGGLNREEWEFYERAIQREMARQAEASKTSLSYHVAPLYPGMREWYKNREEADAAIAAAGEKRLEKMAKDLGVKA